MLHKLKTGVYCLALCLIMTVQANAAETVTAQKSSFDPTADKVLKSLDAYLKTQKSLDMKAETLLDVVTDDGQIITYTTQVEISLQRPNKLYARRVGLIRNQEIFYNGSELVLRSLQHNVYAKAEVPPTITEMLDVATTQLGLQSAGNDLLYNDLYDGLMSNAVSGAYLGTVMVDGVECHHLAYRGVSEDFQLWVETGDAAKPKRYMIISKEMPGAPRYLLTIKSLEPKEFSDKTFEFTPADGEKRIQFLTDAQVEQVKKAFKEPK